MNRCKTCKSWRKYHDNKTWGDCVELDYATDSIKVRGRQTDSFTETHEDFGCVLWEKQDEPLQDV